MWTEYHLQNNTIDFFSELVKNLFVIGLCLDVLTKFIHSEYYVHLEFTVLPMRPVTNVSEILVAYLLRTLPTNTKINKSNSVAKLLTPCRYITFIKNAAASLHFNYSITLSVPLLSGQILPTSSLKLWISSVVGGRWASFGLGNHFH